MEEIKRGSAIVTTARTWVGTPFRHQGRVRGEKGGVDCWNLVRAVGEECCGLVITSQAFRPFEGYKVVPQDGFLKRALDTFLVEGDPFIPDADLPGHVALIRQREGEDPKHCAIVSEYRGRLTLIHAVEKYGGCVEHGLTGFWQRRIVGLYRYR